jgi:CRP-like cAMP-binding protein
VSLLLKIVGAHENEEVTGAPRMRILNPGELIIEQGTHSRGVYTLIEGLADVSVDGVQVGEIAASEIFGAIAAITDAPRSASVIARTHCLVMEVDRDNFKLMLQTHPSLVNKLIEDMARTIQDLNSQVVALSLLK